MTLEEIKEHYAKNDLNYSSWDMAKKDLHEFSGKTVEWHYSQIAERYAKARVNEALDKAAEEANLLVEDKLLKDGVRVKNAHDSEHYYIIVNKQSILKLKQK